MPDQQKVKQLLDSVQLEITAYEKRETELKRSIKTLEGRQSFLVSAVDTQEEKYKAIKDKNANAVSEGQKQLQEVEDKIVTTRKTLANVHNELRDKQAELSQTVEEAQKELTEVRQEILSQRDLSTKLKSDIENAEEEFANVLKDIQTEKAKLEPLLTGVDDAKKVAQEEVNSYQAKVDLAKKEYSQIQDKVADAHADLEAVQESIETEKSKIIHVSKKEEELAKREEAVIKKLEAREESLKRREAAVTLAERRARSGSVVDNF